MLSNRRDIRQYIYVLDNIIRPFFYLFSLSLLKGKPIDFALLFFFFFVCNADCSRTGRLGDMKIQSNSISLFFVGRVSLSLSSWPCLSDKVQPGERERERVYIYVCVRVC